MIGGIYFAGAPFAGVFRAAVSAGASLAASATITLSASATISPPPARLQATAAIVFTASGNLSVPIDTGAGIWIGGVNVTGRVRVQGVTIHDILNDAPNTASLVVEGAAPAVGQAVRILTGTRLLFAGMVQSINESYKVDPAVPAWAITAIDDTGIANARRPFGVWVDVSATTIAQTITTTFAPGFSTAGIVADLPPVRIVFDGADTFISCLTRLATAVGGYCKIEDRTVYLFTDDTADPPSPIDPDHCFLHDPPIAMTTDSSQLRTRVYGKGYGENIPADLLAGETLVPLENGVTFPVSGRAIAGTKADAAQSERLTYTGRELATAGTLVGPGAAPTTAPILGLAAGTGVESGDHDYAFVYVTAAGRSLPSPLARINVGLVAPPLTALTAAAPLPGPGPDAGSHRYYAVFRTASGATTRGQVSNSVTTAAGIADAPNPGHTSGIEGMGLTLGGAYLYRSTYRRASDGAETGPSTPVSGYLAPSNPTYQCLGIPAYPPPPAGYTVVFYRTANNETDTLANYREIQTPTLEGPQLDGFMYWVDHSESRKSKPLPSANATAIASVPLSAIPSYPSALVTHVDLYREFNNAGAATAKLALSVTNGTTTATDTIPNSGLGAVVPAANTAAANRVNVIWPAGPSAVTNIELFRTPLGSAQLKQFFSNAGNAGGSTIDATPDASLTTNAPVGDTSGLTQPVGQVNPGATALPVASSAPFRAAGGWVSLAGDQVVRYTGITGSTLSGVPATGPGAITTTVVYGSPAQPAPMLTGVSGVTVPYAKGAPIHLWVQRDDLVAQAEHAARSGGDGVVEYLLVDLRRGVDSLTARCDADLALFARPLVTVGYATHDLKTKSGKTIVVDLPAPLLMQATLTIQDVTITKIDQFPGVPPLFTVQASSVRFSLEDTLRRLIAGGLTVGGST